MGYVRAGFSQRSDFDLFRSRSTWLPDAAVVGHFGDALAVLDDMTGAVTPVATAQAVVGDVFAADLAGMFE